MKLFIPTLGTKLVLSKSRTFLFEDNMWNETFWLAIHGQPVRQKYFSGYDRTTGKHETSPVKTTVCDSECFHKATPIKTTFPKGTTLYIEIPRPGSCINLRGRTPEIARQDIRKIVFVERGLDQFFVVKRL